MTLLSEIPIPKDWTCETIMKGCLLVTSGGTPSRKIKNFYKEGTISWVTTKELLDGYIWDTKEHITKEAIDNSSAKILPNRTILLAMYGATVGRLGIIRKEMACNQACCALKTSFDIEFNALFNHGCHPKRPWQTHVFTNLLITRAPGGPQT